jgi:hypothetical protein
MEVSGQLHVPGRFMPWLGPSVGLVAEVKGKVVPVLN